MVYPASLHWGIMTFLHFLVDGICGAALAVYAWQELSFDAICYYFMLYNLLAFGTQWLVGLCLDKQPQLGKKLFLGSVWLLLAGTFSPLGIGVQALCLGVGNSLFHVTVGRMALLGYDSDLALGIFVAGGAVGIALGLAGAGYIWWYRIALTLVAIGAFSYLHWQEFSFKPLDNKRPELLSRGKGALLSGALLLCIFIRSFGSGAVLPINPVLIGCLMAVGKVVGGCCCDLFGYKRTALLILVVGFLAVQLPGVVPGALLLITWNMTMPLTLRLLYRGLAQQEAPGLAFGLAAGMLLPGIFFQGRWSVPVQLVIMLQFVLLVGAIGLWQSRKGVEKFLDR